MKVPILLPNIFNYPFTYETNIALKAGDYVVVPFGNIKIIGMVWDEFEKKSNKNYKIKKVFKKLNVPNLNKNIINFLNWFAQYNMIPKGMALKLLLLSSKAPEKLNQDKYELFKPNFKDNIFDLSLEQKLSLKKMNSSNKKSRVHVLQATTGSGKTTVYF